MTGRRVALVASWVGFLGCIVAANWTLERFGFVDLVGPGELNVPAGVYFAGLVLALRDVIRDLGGRAWVGAAVAVGAVLSWWVEPSFAVASGVAFALGEIADSIVYEPLRRRRWVAAVVASNVVGAVVDSAVFLTLAFSTTDGTVELTAGKAIMVAPGLVLVWAARRVAR